MRIRSCAGHNTSQSSWRKSEATHIVRRQSPFTRGSIDPPTRGAPGITLDYPSNATNMRRFEEQLRDADRLIVRLAKVDDALLVNAERLRVVCRHGVGYDLVDVPALTRRGASRC